jgi:Domain of unknown function (DUF4153)
VIDRWLADIDLFDLLPDIAIGRIVYWFVIASGAWSFVIVRIRERRKSPAPETAVAMKQARTDTLLATVFGKTAVTLSLALFNLLFVVQTAMDGAYLWGGVDLPEGISHAEYAHRGAYPLIVIALLSAAFVLIALRPGSETERSPLVRTLVLAWIGQNVLLVVSAVLRLELYVEAFSLTELRMAAFVWMGLVATGLALIVARILLARSNRWLVGANLIALTVTLYCACFISWPAVIARYNVAHSFEIARTGPSLDVTYLCQLGGQIIPALDGFVEQIADKPFTKREDAKACIERQVSRHGYVMHDWRRWSWRNQRLANYLATEPDVKVETQ